MALSWISKICELLISIGETGAFMQGGDLFVVRRFVRGELPNESFDTFALTPARFFNQMGFDIARGQVRPLLVYEAACDHEERLAALVRDTRAWKGPG